MSNPITDARLALVETLTGLGYRVYGSPVETPAPPCIVIFMQGDWMINPRLGGRRRDLRLMLRLSVATVGGNDKALALLEQMIWDVTGAVSEREAIGAPRLDVSSQTECYVVDLSVIVGT